jgi:putative methyltransferase (TIGR04325 family)
MNHAIKRALRQLAPPAAAAVWKRFARPTIGFTGAYESWTDAEAASTGYDTEAILQRVAAATRKVVRGEAAYERDSVLFDRVEYSWPLLACLLQVALESGSLRVVDFGGSLGTTWRQNRSFLERLRIPISWRVVEQSHFVELGKAEFSDHVLHFDRTIAEAARDGADVILFASSLCYVPDPAEILRQAAATRVRFLLVDRLPVITGASDRIALQSVREPIYNASYPIRLFADERLCSNWLGQWRLVERWKCDLQPDEGSVYQGFFMEAR